MIGLGIPWVGTERDARIIAAIRAGRDAAAIQREWRITPEKQVELYFRYVEYVVRELSDRTTAKGHRASLRDHLLYLISKFYPAAAELNLKAAQFVLSAISLYAKLERDHYDLDRQMLLDQGQENPDDAKARDPLEASRRRQRELDDLEREGVEIPDSARLAGSLILNYHDKNR